jgi:hypothetical protein
VQQNWQATVQKSLGVHSCIRRPRQLTGGYYSFRSFPMVAIGIMSAFLIVVAIFNLVDFGRID